MPTTDPERKEGAPGAGADSSGGAKAAGAAGSGAEPQKFTVVVDGQSVQMTQQEVLEAAAKAAGADKRFNEAAELRKKYENLDPDAAKKGSRVMTLAQKMADGQLTEAEGNEFFQILGIDPNKLEEPSAEKSGKPDKKGREPAARKITKADLDDEMKAIIEENEADAIRRTEQQIQEKVKNVVDKDPQLSKIRNGVPKDRRAAFDKVLLEMAVEDVLDRVYKGARFGPEVLQLTVQRLRQRMEDIGIPTEAASLPVSQVVTGMDYLGREIGSEEPIKRVPIGSDEHEENTIKRFAQMLYNRRRATAR